MTITRILSAAAVMLGAMAPIALAEGLPMTPGLWEVKSQNPMTGQDEIRQECMVEAVFDPSEMMGDDEGCTVSNEVVSGNTVDYDMSCSDPNMPGTLDGHLSFTIDGDQGSGNVDMSFDMNGQKMSMNFSMTAKRIGDC